MGHHAITSWHTGISMPSPLGHDHTHGVVLWSSFTIGVSAHKLSARLLLVQPCGRLCRCWGSAIRLQASLTSCRTESEPSVASRCICIGFTAEVRDGWCDNTQMFPCTLRHHVDVTQSVLLN